MTSFGKLRESSTAARIEVYTYSVKRYVYGASFCIYDKHCLAFIVIDPVLWLPISNYLTTHTHTLTRNAYLRTNKHILIRIVLAMIEWCNRMNRESN